MKLNVLLLRSGVMAALSLCASAALAAEVTTSYDLPSCGGRAFVTRTPASAWVEIVGVESCSNIVIHGLETKMKRRGDEYRFEAELHPERDEGMFLKLRSNSGRTSDTVYVAPWRPLREVRPVWHEEEDDLDDDDVRVRVRIRETTREHRPRIVVRPVPRIVVRPLPPPPPPRHQVRIRFQTISSDW